MKASPDEVTGGGAASWSSTSWSRWVASWLAMIAWEPTALAAVVSAAVNQGLVALWGRTGWLVSLVLLALRSRQRATVERIRAELPA